MALDIRSPMDLVYECFVKLGLRYVCVTKEGRYAGLVNLLLLLSFSFFLVIPHVTPTFALPLPLNTLPSSPT